jgi:hypothetical protein
MSVLSPGDGVLELVQRATTRVVVAAPYIKSHTLRRLIAALPKGVTTFICVTRWLPEDIASGACDLEILDDIAAANGGVLLVHPRLHAKYYAGGERCLVGSANLTGRGLGWHTPANVELLVSLPSDFSGIRQWEAVLLESAIPATFELREQLRKEADRLKASTAFQSMPEVEGLGEEETPLLWVPSCPAPERLWLVYRGIGADRMVSSAYEAAKNDLAALRPPAGLTQPLFEAYIAGILRLMPLMVEIDKLAASGLTDSQALAFLTDKLPLTQDISHEQVWRVFKAWLTHFFPKSYRLETRQEVLVKGKELSRR